MKNNIDRPEALTKAALDAVLALEMSGDLKTVSGFKIDWQEKIRALALSIGDETPGFVLNSGNVDFVGALGDALYAENGGRWPKQGAGGEGVVHLYRVSEKSVDYILVKEGSPEYLTLKAAAEHPYMRDHAMNWGMVQSYIRGRSKVEKSPEIENATTSISPGA